MPTELTKVVEAVEHEICGRTRQILLLQLGRCIDEGVRPPHFPSALRFRTVRSHAGPRLYPRSDDTHLALRGIRCRSGSLSPGLVWPAEVRRLWHEAGLDEAASQLPADVPGTRRERLSAVRRLVEQARRLLTESGCQYVHLPAGREQANDGDGWPPDDGWHFHSNNHVAAFQRHVFELKYPIHYRLLKCLAHARFAVPDDRLIEAGWEGETSTKKNLQNHLSQLRVTLRSQFGLDHQVDPIPVRGVGADAVWCLDSESLKKGSKLSADRESS